MGTQKKNNRTYQLITEGELAKEINLKQIVTPTEILYDIKFLIKDYYLATFQNTDYSLTVKFNTGDAFKIEVFEVSKDYLEQAKKIYLIKKFTKNAVFEKSNFITDLKVLLKDFYTLILSPDENGLLLSLSNNQSFLIYVTKI